MLTETEKKRLRTRDKLNPHTRNTNDLRVRRKLKAWLDDINDIEFILDYLPVNQLNKVINKASPNYLLSITFAIKKANHSFIVGELEYPDTWKILEVPYSKNEKVDESFKPVKDLDIILNLHMLNLIQGLAAVAGTNANLTCIFDLPNPIASALHLTKIPNIKNRLTEGEQKGIERINQARRNYGFEELNFRQLKPQITKA